LREAVMDQTQMARVRRTAWKRNNESSDVSVYMSDVSVRNYIFMSLKKTSDRIIPHYSSLVQEKQSKCKSVLMYRQI